MRKSIISYFNKKILRTLLFLMFPLSSFAQTQSNEKVNQYLTNGNTIAAIEELKKNPLNIANQLNIGILYHNIGKESFAIEWYRKVLITNPNDFDCNYNIGVLFFNQAVVDKRVIDQMNAQTYSIKGPSAEEKVCSLFNTAKYFFNKCLSVKPDDFEIKNNLSVVSKVLLQCKQTISSPSSDSEIKDIPVKYSSVSDNNISLGNLAIGAIALYGISQLLNADSPNHDTTEQNHSFVYNLINCSTSVGIGFFVDNPIKASIVAEAYGSIVQKKGISLKNISSNVLQGFLVDELRNKNQNELANIIEISSYIGCLTK